MTIEPSCYVCGKEMPCINGICPDCTMKEFENPGGAFAATFGILTPPTQSDSPVTNGEEDEDTTE